MLVLPNGRPHAYRLGVGPAKTATQRKVVGLLHRAKHPQPWTAVKCHLIVPWQVAPFWGRPFFVLLRRSGAPGPDSSVVVVFDQYHLVHSRTLPGLLA